MHKEKTTWAFVFQNVENFEVIRYVISSSINLLFLKSASVYWSTFKVSTASEVVDLRSSW